MTKKNKRKIKLVILAICVMLMGTLFSGCNGNSEKENGEKTSKNDGAGKTVAEGNVEETGESGEGWLPKLYLTTETGKDVTSKEEYIGGSLKITGSEGHDLDTVNIQVRGRGNGTWNFEKKSYKIKLETKDNLLGIGEGKSKKWALLANACDATLLRNYTALNLGESFEGIDYMPACTSVDLYLNGEYRGVYLLCEQIEEKKHKVKLDLTNIDKSTDIGYLFEMSYYADDVVFTAANRTFKLKSDISADKALASKQVEYIASYVDECWKAVKAGDKETIESLIDLDSLIDTYLLEETVKNKDCGWDSFNMYKKAGGKMYFGPAWDFDLSLGNADDGTEYYTDFYAALNLKGQSNPWFYTIMKYSWFREMVVEHWDAQKQNRADILVSIREAEAAGLESFKKNYDKWPTLGTKMSCETKYILSIETYEGQVDYLIKWMEDRYEWLDKHFHSEDFLGDKFVSWAVDMWNKTTGDSAVALSEVDVYGASEDQPYGTSVTVVNDIISCLNGRYNLLNYLVNQKWITSDTPGYGTENETMLFDNDTSTKYCSWAMDPYTVYFEFTEPAVVTDYVLFTGNDTADHPERNPESWTLYGRNSRNDKWEIIDYVFDGTGMETASRTGTSFECDSPASYKYYMFALNNNGDMLQLSEIWLLEKESE
ncbi:MAG: CotH kinase family protein [Lachnospiraceae bacterium]|nr:CotH kinase family protein [Lachnospiraceae bacterium]